VYLVEIDINYNDEKNYKYYRIFYNSYLFNEYYMNENYLDYKDISLNEVLNSILKTSTKYTTISNDIISFDPEEPDVVVEEPTDKEYTLVDSYSGSDKVILTATASDVFEVDIENIVLTESEGEYSDDATASQISGVNLQSSISLDEIEHELSEKITTNTNIINNDFEYKLKIPLKIKYNTQISLNVSY